MEFHITAACVCNRGKVRSNNEDNFFFQNQHLLLNNSGLKKTLSFTANTDKVQCLGVFDGMGGESDGERASYLAAKTLYQRMQSVDECISSPRDFLNDYYSCANLRICREMSKTSNKVRMGTTAALLYFSGNEIYASNIGDSRIYRHSKSGLKEISEEHTDRHLLEQIGSKSKPKLLQHLGIFESEMQLSAHITKGSCKVGDRYLICSDGLTDMVSDEEIEKILNDQNDVQKAAEALCAKALDAGGRDNLTIIVCQIEAGHVPESAEKVAVFNRKTARVAIVCAICALILSAGIFLSVFFFNRSREVHITISNEVPIGLVMGDSVTLQLQAEPSKEHLRIQTDDEQIARIDGDQIISVSPGSTQLLVIDTRTDETLASCEILIFP